MADVWNDVLGRATEWGLRSASGLIWRRLPLLGFLLYPDELGDGTIPQEVLDNWDAVQRSIEALPLPYAKSFVDDQRGLVLNSFEWGGVSAPVRGTAWRVTPGVAPALVRPGYRADDLPTVSSTFVPLAPSRVQSDYDAWSVRLAAASSSVQILRAAYERMTAKSLEAAQRHAAQSAWYQAELDARLASARAQEQADFDAKVQQMRDEAAARFWAANRARAQREVAEAQYRAAVAVEQARYQAELEAFRAEQARYEAAYAAQVIEYNNAQAKRLMQLQVLLRGRLAGAINIQFAQSRVRSDAARASNDRLVARRGPKKDSKAGGGMYRSALRLINATWGRASEGFEVVQALVDSLYLEDAGQRVYFVDLYRHGYGPYAWRDALQGLADGTLEVDMGRFAWGLANNILTDQAIGRASRREDALRREWAAGRPIGLGMLL